MRILYLFIFGVVSTISMYELSSYSKSAILNTFVEAEVGTRNTLIHTHYLSILKHPELLELTRDKNKQLQKLNISFIQAYTPEGKQVLDISFSPIYYNLFSKISKESHSDYYIFDSFVFSRITIQENNIKIGTIYYGFSVKKELKIIRNILDTFNYSQLLLFFILIGFTSFLIIKNQKYINRIDELYIALQEAIFETDRDFNITKKNSIFEKLFPFTNLRLIFKQPEIIKELEDRGVINGRHEINSVDGEILGAIRVLQSSRYPNTKYSGTIRDVTEENKRVSAEFQQLKMRSISEITAGITHEFNNMLQGILFKLHTLLRDSEGNLSNKQVQLLDDSFAIIEKAKEVTQTLLLLTKKQPMKQKIVKLSSIIKDVIKICEPLLKQAEVDFSIKSLDTSTYISVDSSQLVIGLQNLIINSIDSTNESTKKTAKISLESEIITFTSETIFSTCKIKEGAYVRIRVQDNGMGVPKSVENKIFDPYFTTKAKGTGIGLSLVRGIVEGNNGYITFSSNSNRTCFDVYLPHVKPSKYESDIPSFSPKLYDGANILVVDDNPSVTDMLKAYFEGIKMKPIVCNSALEALEFLKVAKFELLVTDLKMPNMDGYQLINRARSLDEHLPILVVTAYFNTNKLESLLYRDNLEVLKKPFVLKDLSAILENEEIE